MTSTPLPSSDCRLSVAVVTRNRPGSLERTLRALRAQDVQPFEVVVSDDSDADSADSVRALAETFGCRYVSGPRRGLYANRNHAVDACLGTHVRTMDDDHEFPDGHMSTCLAAVRADSDAIWIIGEFTPTEVARAELVPCPGQLNARGFSDTPGNPQACWAIADGATIYPRRVFDAGSRFAEYFKFGASYLEFGSRLHWLGWRVRHLRATYVIHHFDPATRSYLDPSIDLGARVFAMLCHSFVYQPTSTNRLWTVLEIARQCASTNAHGRRGIRAGVASYVAHRRNMAQRRGTIDRPGAPAVAS